ncbi:MULTISPECIES: ABC transporter substrate-binding protein [Streptomyces]|uniref:Iron-siderophore ABC transporter substrate-binding protein n=1 Tax=Streptomyces lycii TaxID=2654337 RepID=A0ABQ7FDS9_9ACTN|nr:MULTISPECIES: iron-siderophore ABC transporter substrate-binding protein [Streptomyces]KAF4406445.1 iron-siderophore ABC transporter substrate-binding protein [Streptomyces lycii]PGH46798.1 iron ABC transporter substrate-binding protein [Streptomyces sp. Ru87]
MPSSRSARPGLTAAVALTAATVLTLAGCGSEDSGGKAAAKAGGGSEGRTVTDATGAEVETPAQPKKVVTLSENDLDSALALGVKPVGLSAGRGQKGAPEYLGDDAKGIPVVGAVTGPDIEKVVRARPDLILAGQIADKQVLSQLREIAPTVVTAGKGKTWKDSFTLAGEALNKSDEAKSFLADYDRRVDEVKEAIGDRAGSSVSVARYSARGTAVMQQGVFISDVLKDLGFERPGIQNDRGEGHSTPVGDEDIEQIDGDWLFIGTLASTGKDADLFEELKKKPAYRQVGAVEKGNVTEIDGSMWTSVGGARASMKVLDDIEKAMAE